MNNNINFQMKKYIKFRDFINLDKIYWWGLSRNPAAITLIEANPDKINWNKLSLNPNIITYDYKLIKKENKINLNEYFYHPSKVNKFLEKHEMEQLENNEYYIDYIINM